MTKITDEVKSKMIEMRRSGSTYSEIELALGVTKERCMAYLKGIKSDIPPSAMTNDWRKAELEAKGILEKLNFKNIHDLNSFCFAAPYWDYLAEKDGLWWLIDVTINGQKSIAAKNDAIVDGYHHAILLKTNENWKFINIKMEVMEVLPNQ